MNQEIDRFFEYLSTERCLATNTLAAYRNDLSQFTEYLASARAGQFLEDASSSPNGSVRPSTVSREAVVDFFIFLKDERRYSAATIARKMAAVKSLYQFLVRIGEVGRNPVADVGSPEVKKTLPRALTMDDVSLLMNQVAKRPNSDGARDCAMFHVLYATGMRVTEMVSLDLQDVNLDEPTIRCVGRGGRVRVLPIDDDATLAMRAYLGDGRSQLVRSGDTPALFLNHRGQRLTRQGFWLIMKGLARDAGLTVQVTPHTLRHSFAAHRLSAGIALPRLRYLLGHANLSTTQIYTQLRDQARPLEDEPAMATQAR